MTHVQGEGNGKVCFFFFLLSSILVRDCMIAFREQKKSSFLSTQFNFTFTYEYACISACLYVHQMCAGAPQRPQEDVGFPGTGAGGAREPVRGPESSSSEATTALNC